MRLTDLLVSVDPFVMDDGRTVVSRPATFADLLAVLLDEALEWHESVDGKCPLSLEAHVLVDAARAYRDLLANGDPTTEEER